MDKSLEVLYNEHAIIKSIIIYKERINEIAISEPAKYRIIIFELIDFFRNYADKFHHYKEEKLLFPLMCEKSEALENSIINEMLNNHSDFRELIKQIENAANIGNFKQSAKALNEYAEALLDHIAVEEDELFQIAETLLNQNELERIYYDFQDVDLELGLAQKNNFEKIKEKLESELYSK